MGGDGCRGRKLASPRRATVSEHDRAWEIADDAASEVLDASLPREWVERLAQAIREHEPRVVNIGDLEQRDWAARTIRRLRRQVRFLRRVASALDEGRHCPQCGLNRVEAVGWTPDMRVVFECDNCGLQSVGMKVEEWRARP
jgi:hypothetical protein